MTSTGPRYDDLSALFFNCTLKPSPQLSHTQGLIDRSSAIMARHGVRTETIRAIDHDIATGVWPDMTEHGAASRRLAAAVSEGAGRRHPGHRRPDLAR